MNIKLLHNNTNTHITYSLQTVANSVPAINMWYVLKIYTYVLVDQQCQYVYRKLGAEEAVRQAVESREAQVKEKAESLEQTETRHR